MDKELEFKSGDLGIKPYYVQEIEFSVGVGARSYFQL